jgi:hypothetical protein
MTRKFLLLSIVVVITLACNLPLVGTDPDTAEPGPAAEPTDAAEDPAAAPPEATAESQPAPEEANRITFGRFSFVLSPDLASGASEEIMPRMDSEEGANWGLTPGHQQITLDGYLLADKFHQPRFFVYPAQEYAGMIPQVSNNLQSIQAMASSPAGPFSAEQLPGIPFFNAAQVFASNIEVIEFHNGSGVRFLTEYAQYMAPANNHDLFYQFQGISADGSVYIIGVFPITAPLLAESSEPDAAIPPGGIAFPDWNDPEPDFAGYYAAVTNLLNATPGESFAPTLAELDLMMKSIEILP